MDIQQMSDKTGVPKEAIRVYLREGLLPKNRQPGTEREPFTQWDLMSLPRVAALRKAGFSYTNIRDMVEYPLRTVTILQGLVAQKEGSGDMNDPLLSLLRPLLAQMDVTTETIYQALKDIAPSLPFPAEDLAAEEPAASAPEGPAASDDVYFQMQQADIEKGRRIMKGLTTVAMALYTIGLLMDLGFESLISTGIMVALFYATYRGIAWAKYLLVALHAASVVQYLPIVGSFYDAGLTAFSMPLLIPLVLQVVIICILLFNPKVKEFLWAERDKRRGSQGAGFGGGPQE